MVKFGRSWNGIRDLYLLLPAFRRLSTSSSTTKKGNPSSSLSDFLVNSLGFSNPHSLSTSAKLVQYWPVGGTKRVSDFDFVEKANSVILFFIQLGFQQSHIREIVSRDPRILVSRVDNTLKPKIKLLSDLGISGSDLVQTVVGNPYLLSKRLGPAIQAYRIVLGSDDNVVRILKRSSQIQFGKSSNYLIANVQLLRSYCGISSDRIQRYILMDPCIFSKRTELFRNILINVEHKLGIPRDSAMFVYGIQLLAGFSEKNIEDKCEVFKSFGWTQSDIMELIKRNPLCLTSAEARIKKRLDFLMNQLGYKPTYLTSQSLLFFCSMEKRLLPRHRVLQMLKEKGLLRMNYHLSSAICLTESMFLKRFVLPFEEVHEVYAQLTGSTVGSLKVGRAKKPILKMSLNSNTA